jgi:sugar lactone lactonase YvrE
MCIFTANRRKVFNLAENGVAGHPDGMTIDSEGNLWIAVFDGSQVCIFLAVHVLTRDT